MENKKKKKNFRKTGVLVDKTTRKRASAVNSIENNAIVAKSMPK